MSRIGRRSFLCLAGGSAVLASWLQRAVAAAEGAAPARRFLMIQRPNGTIPEQWITGGKRGFIMEPFADVWPWSVAVQGVDACIDVNNHEKGILGLMTGAPIGATMAHGDDYRSTAESLDQTILKRSTELQGRPIPSLQLGARDQEGGNIYLPNATMSYSGPAAPLYPVIKPDEVYLRLFGSLQGGSSIDPALLRERKRRKSALDFVKADLARVKAQFPAERRADLEVYEGAIREAETSLDGSPTGVSCTPPSAPPAVTMDKRYQTMETVGNAHLALVKAAFVCDLTRVVTFQWAPGFSGTNFEDLYGVSDHHFNTHNGDQASRDRTAMIDRWFSQRTAAFVQQLADTKDATGTALIERTLVWYVNEVSDGLPHSGSNYPFMLFGGDGVGLKDRGRIADVTAQKPTTNDLWSAIGNVFGATLGPFTTRASGPVKGVFA